MIKLGKISLFGLLFEVLGILGERRQKEQLFGPLFTEANIYIFTGIRIFKTWFFVHILWFQN
jgi:hypothetical protein